MIRPIEMTIKFKEEREARCVLGYLQEMIRLEGSVSAADLWGAMEIYKFIDKDQKIGWQSLTGANIVTGRDGCQLLRLPMPTYI